MNTYLRTLFVYFEHVLHPAGDQDENNPAKRKRKLKGAGGLSASPESCNMRGAAAKQDKLRRNPAP